MRFQELSVANNPELVAARVILSFDMDAPISCNGVKCILVERKIRVIGRTKRLGRENAPKRNSWTKLLLIAFLVLPRCYPQPEKALQLSL